ncbi:MAG: hypothetical protein GX851_01995 [Clostridiales bacterium]|nr:hypothetical protein [Clostridiales bacterium]
MKKALKVIGIVLVVLAVLVGSVYLTITHDFNDPIAAIEESANPYIVKTGQTMVSAHRSGGDIAPENTMAAFENCVKSSSFSIDMFEFDLHITKDGELILLHDSTFDRTSNSAEHFGAEGVLPSEKTYEELRELNMGENFKNEKGEMPYKGLRGDEIPENLHVVRLEDVFDYLRPYGDYSFIIEIKDGDELGKKGVDKLFAILKAYDMLDRVVFGTFNGEISEYVDEKYPDMLRSAGIVEVVNFYFSSLIGIDHEKGYYKFDALQIPDDDYVFNLGTTRLVNYAHKYDIAVQYWTINNPEDVKHLQSIGADAVMSDNPDMAYKAMYGDVSV